MHLIMTNFSRIFIALIIFIYTLNIILITTVWYVSYWQEKRLQFDDYHKWYN